MMLRIAVLPLVSQENMHGISDWEDVWTDIKEGIERKGWYFYVLYPDFVIDNFDLDEYEEWSSNLEFVSYEIPERFAGNDENQVYFPEKIRDLFHAKYGLKPIDAIYTDRVEAGHMLQRNLIDNRTSRGNDFRYQIPVIVVDGFAVDENLTTRVVTNDKMIERAVTYVACNTFFLSEFEKKKGRKLVKRYLSPAMLMEFEKRARVSKDGVDLDRFDNITVDDKYDKFTVFMGARWNGNNRNGEVVEAFRDFYSTGVEAQLVMTTGSDASSKVGQYESDSVKIHTNVGHNEYIRKMKKSHVCIRPSSLEGLSKGVLEHILSGNPSIHSDKEWFRVLVGDELYDRYKFKAYRKNDLVDMMCYIYENYDECKELAEGYAEEIREMYPFEDRIKERLKYIEEIVREEEEHNATMEGLSSDAVKELFEETYEVMPDEFTFDSFTLAYVKKSDSLDYSSFSNPTKGRASKWVLYKWMKEEAKEQYVNDEGNIIFVK